MVKKHHLRERINSKKYCKTPSLIYCLMNMMMRAVMMKMLVVAIVMVWRGGGIDIGSDDDSDELDDGDFLSQLLRHTKAEVLVGSAKGIENF